MEHHQAREENTKIHLAVPAAPPKPQHKCPRCNSTNTKFCYFNNYSLSQPRHFCKTCKRYWTQGGTFRNIPVGGASRKAKRGKTDSSPSNSLTQPHSDLVNPSPSLTMAHSTTPYYQLGGGGGGGGGGGYLSSLATLHSLTPSQPFNHYLNVAGSSSILPLLSGFNAAAAASFPPRFHHVGIRERMESLYPAPQRLLPSNVSGGSAAAAAQSLISDVSSTNLTAGSDVSFWTATINATSISGNSDRNNVKGGSSSSLIPNHWLHPPGYRPPQ